MRSPHRCKCDECRSVEMVLYELDCIASVKVVTREREMLSAVVE